MTSDRETKVLLESWQGIEVARDFYIVCSHDDRDGDEHRPKFSLAVDFDGIPGAKFMFGFGSSVGQVSGDGF